MATFASNCTSRSVSLLLLSVLLLIVIEKNLIVHRTQAASVDLESPAAKRTEGRVTLEYFKNDEKHKYQLAFSEVVDSDTKRSKISIGYVSYGPQVYYSRAGNILTVDKQNKCVNLQSLGHKFVPELDWFIKLSFTDEELKSKIQDDKIHHIGPTGISLLLARYTKFDRTETHRNVECQVISATYDRTKAKNVVYEILVPSLKMFDSPKMSLFAFRESAMNFKDENGDTISTIMTVDYFYTEKIDKTALHQLDRLEMDLNLPFGVGCTEHTTPTQPQVPSARSFIMTYTQNSAQSLMSLAYDHEWNYLRKEIVGQSVGVWDLNEDLFYHVDLSADGKLANNGALDVPTEVCSVISLEGDGNNGEGGSGGQQNEPSTSSILRPYTPWSKSLEVLEFLGAKTIYYVGQATVRDMPCLVYETILSEPPKVFNIDMRVDSSLKSSSQIDFIVQYYIFKTTPTAATGTGSSKIDPSKYKVEQRSSSSMPLIGDQFWPARVNLIRRHKATGRVQLHDSLEIVDFHWGLFGWTKKPSELFMMPECFSDEDEQLSVNLALEFAQHDSVANQKVLRHNKYKLEKDLLNELFNWFQISQMHLTEFQLALRPNNVLASLVISDRIEDKRLTYFGEGDLPSIDSYLNNRIALQLLDKSDHGGESACILKAAHVSQISMVIYCPRKSSIEEPTCTAIFGESQPVIKRTSSSPSSSSPAEANMAEDPFSMATACRAYRFEPREPPTSGTNNLNKIRGALANHRFMFTADGDETTPSDGADSLLVGKFVDFDVSHELQLIIINNYKFAHDKEEAKASEQAGGAAPAAAAVESVRVFDSIAYNNLGDCMKMCNLDSNCKSYSYCEDDQMSTGKCVLASLDLRLNTVENQLVSAQTISGNQVIVRDLYASENQASEYKLMLNSACNIHERDHMSMFSETDELVSIDRSLASHYLTTTSAFECARWVHSLEETLPTHHSAMFAYCPSSNNCLIDESLFVSINNSSTSAPDQAKLNGDNDPDSEASSGSQHELLCQVYRKRYQNYFHVSPLVLKRIGPGAVQEGGNAAAAAAAAVAASEQNSPIKQVELQFGTVEECARACWDSFGHACISFDYCLPQSCIVNLINSNAPTWWSLWSSASSSSSSGDLDAKLEHESRTGCLHYERDLELDKLRRNHLIGRHNPLDLESTINGQHSTGANFALNLLYYLATSALFIVGLAIGRKFNERLEHGHQPFRSTSAASNGAGSRANYGGMSFSSFARSRPSRGSTSSRSKFNIENEIYGDEGADTAIQLEDFGQRSDVGADELTTAAAAAAARNKQTANDDSRNSPSPSSGGQQRTTSPPNGDTPNHDNDQQTAPGGLPTQIEVPNLLL